MSDTRACVLDYLGINTLMTLELGQVVKWNAQDALSCIWAWGIG